MKSKQYKCEVLLNVQGVQGDPEIVCNMTFGVTPFHKGSFRDGLQIEPDEEPVVEDIQLEIIEITENAMEALEEDAWEHVGDVKEGFAEDWKPKPPKTSQCNKCKCMKTYIEDMLKDYEKDLNQDEDNIIAAVAIDIYKDLIEKMRKVN